MSLGGLLRLGFAGSKVEVPRDPRFCHLGSRSGAEGSWGRLRKGRDQKLGLGSETWGIRNLNHGIRNLLFFQVFPFFLRFLHVFGFFLIEKSIAFIKNRFFDQN